jgi:hypothetical protein
MKILLMILSVTLAVSSQDFDALMKSSAEQVRHYDMVPLVPPEELFVKNDSIVKIPKLVGTPKLSPLHLNQSFVATQAQMTELEKRTRELEINVTKVMVILENMQKVNEKHTDKFDTYMKFFEVIITALAGIITALIGVYFKGRKRS